MKTPQPVTVTPRQPHDPEPDLIGITLAHRAMLTDVGRLAAAATAIGEGRQRCSTRRAQAIARYADLLCESIHHHHTVEDTVLWPVIDACAKDIVDLTELTEDHAALDPRLEIIGHRANAFRVAGDRRTAALLGAELADLRSLLTEHIAEEERDIFPVIRQYVSVADWQEVEKTAQRTGRLTFDGPRTVGAATDDERAALAKEVSPVLRLLLTVLARRHRKFEDEVFSG
ncbi:hemerythrin domain-containing protein [Mycobacterium crocinum]|uniref:Hemerythrin domain-containing protein n=1 Tax=Mycolicibacterium crocinum TaxID=388459 RepID=A0ABY3TLK5_9MYCO|nr:hemerythrin domain-containing protein [Mycolicibacterium crocinum]MCV7216911.1 hemerythrin domain-containing protein [Mycolicibacterium crocinum]ULN40172.1 hemerythrin domain-containing protein [Mycolicibacterium crocinum]